MSEYETIELSIENDVATLAFDRPEKRNAMNPTLLSELDDALEQIREDVHALVVTGNGEAFNAGMDFDVYFEELRGGDPRELKEANRIHGQALSKLKRFARPTIAKVNGWTIGGGYIVMALCDLVVAADTAKFCLSEINFGIPAGGGAMWAAAHTLNRRDAVYYVSTGETFDGTEAERMGAINEAVPSEELDERVDELAETLLDKNELALEYTKYYYDKVRWMEFEEAHDYELAKGEEMKYFQQHEFLSEGVGQFTTDRYKPGAGESYDRRQSD